MPTEVGDEDDGQDRQERDSAKQKHWTQLSVKLTPTILGHVVHTHAHGEDEQKQQDVLRTGTA